MTTAKNTKPRMFPIPEWIKDFGEHRPLEGHKESMPDLPSCVLAILGLTKEDISDLDWFDDNDVLGWGSRFSDGVRRATYISEPNNTMNLEIYSLDTPSADKKKSYCVVWCWEDKGRKLPGNTKCRKVYHVLKAGVARGTAQKLARKLQKEIDNAEGEELTIDTHGQACEGKIGISKHGDPKEILHTCAIGDLVRFVGGNNSDTGWIYKIVSETRHIDFQDELSCAEEEPYYTYIIEPVFTGIRDSNRGGQEKFAYNGQIQPVSLVELGLAFSQLNNVIKDFVEDRKL